MTNQATQGAVPEQLRPLLERTPHDPRPVVLATCGIAGAGKTTLAKAIVAAHPRFVRLSGDEMIAARHGLYGVDYAASAAVYAAHQDEADGLYLAALQEHLARGARDLVLDRSFYAREDRAAFAALVAAAGARWLLVFLRPADKELLWRRIQARAAAGPKDPNSALDIDRDTFDGYCSGFEDPCGEGEIVIEVT